MIKLHSGNFIREDPQPKMMGLKALSFLLVAVLSASTLTYTNVLADEPVQITADKKYVDESGFLHIIGLIENTGVMPVGFVRITASLADELGKPLPLYDAVALIKTVLPGYVTPFDIPISDRTVGDRVGSYTLSLKWSMVDVKSERFEFTGMNAYTVTHWDPRTVGYMGSYHNSNMHHMDEVHAHTEASGYISNSGELPAQSVRVAVIWYDKEGKFYGYDSQLVSKKLASGENARFVFMTHPNAMGYYSIVAEGDNFVGMLEENDKKIIPVYELSRPNMQSQSNAITVSDVKLTDESNKPVSDVKAGQMILLQTVMKNNLDAKQRFISIYHIVDSDGNAVMLFWMSSNIPAGESIDTAISWIPESKGAYALQIFTWESMTNPVPLGDFSETAITVSG